MKNFVQNPCVGYLVHFAEGMCTPARVSFHLFFLCELSLREGNFLQSVVNSVFHCFPMNVLCFGVYSVPIFSEDGYHFE